MTIWSEFGFWPEVSGQLVALTKSSAFDFGVVNFLSVSLNQSVGALERVSVLYEADLQSLKIRGLS